MTKKRSVYLTDIPLAEARARLNAALTEAGLDAPLPAESAALHDALNRVTAEPVWAKVSAPHYHASAMDGYAVRSRDTLEASETHPITLTRISDAADIERVSQPAKPLNTGQPMPLWANAVIMIEHVQEGDSPNDLIIRASVAPWQHVRQMGEDMVATELVLPANHLIRPVDIGAIAGSGHGAVSVRRRPRVAVIPTGSELVSAEDAATGDIERGQIIEYNALVLGAQIETWGGEATRWAIVPDDYQAILSAVREASLDHDLVLVNAGSSAGSEDYTVHVVGELGEVLVHGVAVRPGHPVIIGMLNSAGRPVPVLGVPGYPVSAALTGEIFVEPMISQWLGRPSIEPPTIEATISRKIMSPPGDDEYARVTVGRVGERTIATPLSRGAGVISSLVRADGIVRIPRFSEGVNMGDPVTVHLYRKPKDIERTVVAIGSHDMTLDLLAQFLAERAPGFRLSSANVGSLGGLVALRREEAHLAGAHLLDPETGDYNRSYLKQYLPDQDVVLVTLVGREQGLVIPTGNPKGIRGIGDFGRKEFSFVNRQRGAGTRILFDYEIDKAGIDAESVQGYEREEYTHLAVAAAVASGTADCGLAVRAAARALDLDFVSVGWERYDLVIPRTYYDSELLRPLLDLLYDGAFRAAVDALPGYDTSAMGNVRD